MHFMLFQSSSEEAAVPPFGLDMLGDEDMDRIRAGDVLWLVTRLGAVRASPGLCGRLSVEGVRSRPAGEAGKDAPGWVGALGRTGDVGSERGGRPDRTRRLVVRPAGSGRCEAFECEAIRSWDIWRRQFRGVTPLSPEQGRTLEAVWERQAPHGEMAQRTGQDPPEIGPISD